MCPCKDDGCSNSQIGATNGAVLSSEAIDGLVRDRLWSNQRAVFQNEPNFRSSVGWPQADPRFGATNASGSATRTFPPMSSSNTLTRPLSSNRSSCPTTSAKGPAVTRMASPSFRSKWKRMPPSGSDALMRLSTTPGGPAAALLARSLVGKACAPFALTCLAKGERLYQVKPALAEGAES